MVLDNALTMLYLTTIFLEPHFFFSLKLCLCQVANLAVLKARPFCVAAV